MSKKPVRPYVKSVFSNLKSPLPSGAPWSIELGRYTLLVGSNTSHKSSVIQAVELAASGSVDDVVGRSDVKDSGLLMSLIADGLDELHANVSLSDDDNGSFRLQRDLETGKNKRPQHNGLGDNVLTHRAVRAALSGSVATRRKAFLGWIGGGVSQEDIYACIPSDLHAKFDDLWGHIGRGLSPMDSLIAIGDYTAKQSRDLSKQRKNAESVVSELIDVNLDAAPNDDDIERLNQAVKNAQSLLEAAAACSNGMPESLRQSQMAECEEEMNRLKNDMTQINHQVESLQSQVVSVPDYVKSGLESLTWAIENEIDQCPTCSSQVGSDHLVNCRDFFSKQVDDASAASTSVVTTMAQLESEMQSRRRSYADVERKLTDLSNTASSTDAGLSLEDARDRLNAASLALNNTMIVKSKWDQIVASKELIANLETDTERYKMLSSTCSDAMKSILGSQSERFTKMVNSHLPGDWLFDVVLKDERLTDTFKIGLVRDGNLHEALSGAEWATVTTAISMAVIQLGLSSKQPAILIPEDRAWDGKTLSSVMRSFRNFDGQVIMASTIRPTGRAPAGWTIIDMDKKSSSWLGSGEEPEPEVRNEDVIRRPKASTKNVVTTASAVAVSMMGFSEDDVKLMTRKTAADIIKKNLSPGDITVLEDGSYSLKNGGKVLNLPQPPSRQS